MDDFESAVRRAIEQSQSAFQELWKSVEDGLSGLEEASKNLKPWTTTRGESLNPEAVSTSTAQVANQFVSLIKERSQQVRELFKRQEHSLSTFSKINY